MSMNLKYEPASEPLHISAEVGAAGVRGASASPASRGPASERRGENLKRFDDFHLQANALTVLYVP